MSPIYRGRVDILENPGAGTGVMKGGRGGRDAGDGGGHTFRILLSSVFARSHAQRQTVTLSSNLH
jgi:hypothetical protein